MFMDLGRLAHGHHINTFPNQLFLCLLFSGFLSAGSVSCASGLQRYDPPTSYPHQLQTIFYTLLISTRHTLQLKAKKYTMTLIGLFVLSTFSDPTTMMSYLLSNKGAHMYFGNIKSFGNTVFKCSQCQGLFGTPIQLGKHNCPSCAKCSRTFATYELYTKHKCTHQVTNVHQIKQREAKRLQMQRLRQDTKYKEHEREMNRKRIALKRTDEKFQAMERTQRMTEKCKTKERTQNRDRIARKRTTEEFKTKERTRRTTEKCRTRGKNTEQR